MEIFCSHASKITYQKYFNRCGMCGAEWYSKDPIPLVVIGHTNIDDVIVNNKQFTEIVPKKKAEENKVAKFFKRVWHRITWATQGNQVSYSEANIYECQFCDKRFTKSFFKDICSACVRKAVIKSLDKEK